MIETRSVHPGKVELTPLLPLPLSVEESNWKPLGMSLNVISPGFNCSAVKAAAGLTGDTVPGAPAVVAGPVVHGIPSVRT